MGILYKQLDLQDFHPALLKNFNRYQETNRVWYKENDKYKIKSEYFVEQWDDDKKKNVIQSLQDCVESGGAVIGAFREEELIGFANICGSFFGAHNEYLELPYIHVSAEYRNNGIGQKLFKECALRAQKMGAKKLYIAAHPSEQTQHFYHTVGCTYAVYINQDIFEKEPLEIQLEFQLLSR